ncbi:MAG: hypothetical protein CSB23_05440 [Deltaproteobacteria bacterium]|nr:MAG: hypothetical protein CSB23_05440 [Deltaproteobacteria bacterium]
MKRTLLSSFLVGILLLASITAEAKENTRSGIFVGAGYQILYISDVWGEDINLGVLSGTVGYTIPINETFSIVPQLRLGTGVIDYSVDYVYAIFGNYPGWVVVGVDTEVDYSLGAAVHFQANFKNGISVFAGPSYANVETTSTITTFLGAKDSFSDTFSEFGLGAGVGYNFKNMGVELAYEHFNEIGALSATFKYHF